RHAAPFCCRLRRPACGWLGARRQSFRGRQVEREAKDHSPLTGNDLRNILERKNQEPPALLAGADDEVASAIPAPAQLLDHAEEPLRRFDRSEERRVGKEWR